MDNNETVYNMVLKETGFKEFTSDLKNINTEYKAIASNTKTRMADADKLQKIHTKQVSKGLTEVLKGNENQQKRTGAITADAIKKRVTAEMKQSKDIQAIQNTQAKNMSKGITAEVKAREELQKVTSKATAESMGVRAKEKSLDAESKRLNKLSIDSEDYNSILKSLNWQRNKTGDVLNKSTGAQVKNAEVTKQVNKRYATFQKLAVDTEMPLEQMNNKLRNIGIAYNKQGTAVNTITNKEMRHKDVVAKLNRKYQQFNMNALGIMFFGMSMARTFDTMLMPAMNASGAMEDWNYVMEDLFMPSAEMASSSVSWLSDVVDKLPTPLKNVTNGLVLTGSGLGHVLSVTGQTMLGVKALRTEVPILGRGLKKLETKAGGLKTGLLGTTKTMKGTRKGMVATKASMLSMLLPILAIIAAVALLALAWKGNWGGIRQKTGEVLIWYSGVYDKYIRPVLSFIMSGTVFMANLVVYSFQNLGKNIQMIMIGVQYFLKSAWNGILDITQTGVNALISLVTLPLGLYNIAAEKMGWDKIPIPRLDLSEYKSDTSELLSAGADLATDLDNSWNIMLSNTSNSVTKYNKLLSGVTGTLRGYGEAAILSGERLDYEKMQSTTTNINYSPNVTVEGGISSDMDIDHVASAINEKLYNTATQRWT